MTDCRVCLLIFLCSMHSILRLFRRSCFVGFFCVCVFIVVAFLRLSLNAFAFCSFRLSSLSQAFCALDCNGRSVATIIVRITYAQFCWTRIQLYWPVIWSNIPFCWCASYDTINSLHHFFSLSRFRFLSILFGKCRKSADFCGGIGSFTLHIARKRPFLELFGGYQLNDMMISFPPTTTIINCNPHLPNIPNRFQSHQKKYSFIWKYQFYFYRSLNFFSSLGSVRFFFINNIQSIQCTYSPYLIFIAFVFNNFVLLLVRSIEIRLSLSCSLLVCLC